MDRVCIIEGIMGSGKSSAVINQILRNPDEKLMIIVNYIEEGERYREKLRDKKFKLMGDTIKQSKTADLKFALGNQENIICTKSLFEMNMHLIKEQVSDYVLIIDEAMNDLIEMYKFHSLYVTQKDENNQIDSKKKKPKKDKLEVINNKSKEYTITQKDMNIMLNNKILIKDEETLKISWNKELEEPTIYDILKEDFSNYDIYEFQNNYIKVMPIEIFESFKRIFVITYMWNSQVMKYYFEMHGIDDFHIEYPIRENYKKLTETISQNEENIKEYDKTLEYSLTQNECVYLDYADVLKEKAREHIFIENAGDKWIYKDEAGKDVNLSYSFYLNDSKNPEYKLIVKRLKSNINNCIKHNKLFPNKVNRKVMWTIYKDAIEVITNEEYGEIATRCLNEKNFVSFNKIATNEYSDRNTLFYLIDRYKNPFIKAFIETKSKSKFDEDGFALSELIQWVWRSSIRNNNDIYLYIASDRMNKLFYNWLNSNEITSSKLCETLRKSNGEFWTNFK